MTKPKRAHFGEYDSPASKLRAIGNVMGCFSPDVWEGMSVSEVINACEACMAVGQWGYAEPVRIGPGFLEWRCDRAAVAVYLFPLSA